MSTIYTEWLPDPVCSEVKHEEGRRFNALTLFLKRTWETQRTQPWPECFEGVVDIYATLYQFMETKNQFDLKSVRQVIDVSLEVVFASQHDATVLVRYARAASFFLNKHKVELKGTMTIDWTRLFELCQQILVHNRFIYCGNDALMSIRQSVFPLVWNCGRHYTQDATFALWNQLKNSVTNVDHPESYIALGWLSTFHPSQELSSTAGDWNGLLLEWLSLLERMPLCDYWQEHWFDIIARLVKYDTKGLIDWNVHAPRLFSAILYSFHLPVGTVTSSSNSNGNGTPRRAANWFSTRDLSVERSAAKCIIFLLRNDPTNDVILPYVTKLINLLEQFFHPSNGGQWTAVLAHFFYYLVKHLMKVISKQDLGKVEEKLKIPKKTRRCLVEHILKMASRGQFSKTKDMRSYVSQAFRELAYLEPDLVLPIVYNRFIGAIGSPHAPTTVGSATHAFALCIRPMLMHGLSLPNTEPQATALDAIAQAMMDVLPGLDANDPSKTGNVLRFYAAVFFSIPSLDPQSTAGLILPLDIEIWAEEYLSRIFVLLENMEGPEARTDQSHITGTTSWTGTFLLKDTMFFDWCIEALLMKLPEALRLRAVKRISAFLLSTPLPRSSKECERLCEALTFVANRPTVQHLILPLMTALKEDLPPAPENGLNKVAFTHALTTKICWNLRLLSSCLNQRGGTALLDMKDICELIDRGVGVTNREIQEMAGAYLLRLLIFGLLSEEPNLNNDTMVEHVLSSGIVRWVSKYPENWTKPKWQPFTRENADVVSELVDRYLTRPLEQLEALMADNAMETTSPDSEDLCNSHINKIRGILSSLDYYFVDFEMPEAMQQERQRHPDATPLSPAGTVTIKIGKPGLRERLCSTLYKLCLLLEDANPTILLNLLEVIDMATNIGSIVPPDDYGSLSDPDDDSTDMETFFIEPPVSHPDLTPAKRRPYYQAITRVWGEHTARVGDAAYQSWHSTLYPSMKTPDTVPTAMGLMMEPLFRLTIHPYDEVANSAHVTIEKLFRRFPILSHLYAPLILPSLTRLPIPEDVSMEVLVKHPEIESDILNQMEAFMDAIDADAHPMKEDADLAVEALKDAGVRGSVTLMHSSFHAWKGLFRVPEKTARMIYTLMGCRTNMHADTQQYITFFVFKFLQRFVPLPYMFLGRSVPEVDRWQTLLCGIGKEGVLSNWKFSILANILILITLPRERQNCVALLDHFFSIAICSLPLLRRVGLSGIYAVLHPLTSTDRSTDSPVAQLAKEKFQDAGFVKRFIQVMIDDHETANDGHSNRGRSHSPNGNASFEEELAKGGHAFVDRYGMWPEGKHIEAISNGTFHPFHATILQDMSVVAPDALGKALKSITIELAKRVSPQNDDKHEMSTLAEILAGFGASGAAFIPDATGVIPWDDWFASVMKEALSKCPLEFGTGAFAVALKYAVYHLLHPAIDRQHFLKMAQIPLEHEEKTGTGQSTADLKQLAFLNNVFKEIEKAYALSDLPVEFAPLYESVVAICKSKLSVGFQSVRKRAALLISLISSYLLSHSTEDLPPHCQRLSLMAQELLEIMVGRFYDGVRAIQSSDGAALNVAGGGAMEIDEEQGASDLSDFQSKIGIVVQFVVTAMRRHHLIYLVPTLLKLLPGIFQIQEVSDARLKPLLIEARSCFASIKSLRVEVDRIDGVVKLLREATQSAQWHERGAAVVFLQVFWYHHSLVLSGHQSKALQSIVLALLEDEKLEIQDTACSTLSGMIKGMTEEEQTQLRNHFLSQIRSHYPGGRRKKSTSTSTDLHKKHGCVLGLKAFVIAHPYDIPPWMAEVLTAMIPAAHDKNPIKTTVTKTLGDFKTTHESESHEELRNAFDAETWENIQGVGSQASYFT